VCAYRGSYTRLRSMNHRGSPKRADHLNMLPTRPICAHRNLVKGIGHRRNTGHGWGIRVGFRCTPPITSQTRRGRRAESRRRQQVMITQTTRADFYWGGSDASINAQRDADEDGQHRGFALCTPALRQDAGDRWWWVREKRILDDWWSCCVSLRKWVRVRVRTYMQHFFVLANVS
jgi:hypothetical protein